jgi:hypothetical protein
VVTVVKPPDNTILKVEGLVYPVLELKDLKRTFAIARPKVDFFGTKIILVLVTG